MAYFHMLKIKYSLLYKQIKEKCIETDGECKKMVGIIFFIVRKETTYEDHS